MLRARRSAHHGLPELPNRFTRLTKRSTCITLQFDHRFLCKSCVDVKDSTHGNSKKKDCAKPWDSCWQDSTPFFENRRRLIVQSHPHLFPQEVVIEVSNEEESVRPDYESDDPDDESVRDDNGNERDNEEGDGAGAVPDHQSDRNGEGDGGDNEESDHQADDPDNDDIFGSEDEDFYGGRIAAERSRRDALDDVSNTILPKSLYIFY